MTADQSQDQHRAEQDRAEVDRHSRGIVSTAGLLLVRRIVITVVAAVATAVVARSVSTETFGTFSSVLAAFYLAQAFCDLGFSAVLARELGAAPDRSAPLLRATLTPALVWSVLVAAGFAVFAMTSPTLAGTNATLVLVPAVAAAGLSVVRQLSIVAYNVRRIAAIDLGCSLVQSTAIILVAALSGSAVVLAAVVSVMFALNAVAVAVGSRRRDRVRTPFDRALTRRVVVMALPIGIPSVLASAYFTVDVPIAGHLLGPEAVAPYAAAVKLLTMVTVLPALLMSVALPGFSALEKADDPSALSTLVSRVWHLLVSVCLPTCVAIAIFAPEIVTAVFGARYLDAAPSLSVLMGAGIMSLVCSVAGMVLIAIRRIAPTVVQNVVALVLNVSLNLLLLPVFGVIAAAWLTLGTEALIAVGSLWLLRRTLRWRVFGRISRVPMLATVAAAAVAVTPLPWPALRAALAVVVFVAVMSGLKGWPDELARFGTTLTARLRRNPA